MPSSWPLAVPRDSWAAISRALAEGSLHHPDDLLPGTGAGTCIQHAPASLRSINREKQQLTYMAMSLEPKVMLGI